MRKSPSSNCPQDVSLEPAGSIPFSFSLRSPGKTSPLRGRNMKEYEEQLEHLKKENFALKLRIYFLEERMGHKGIKEDKEELHKANIELKVETEALKKELCDKQELVRQAAALLTNLESQFKEQLQAAQETHEKETEDLKTTITALQKDVDEYSERLRQEGAGDLTRLCGLAFSTAAEDGNDLTFCNTPIVNGPIMPPAHLQGVFSMQESVGSPNSEHSLDSFRPSFPDAQKEFIPESAKKRIKELEEEVKRLTTKVQTLQDTLQSKERTSQALQEDIVNLKKEIEEREDKLYDLELEVTEKDQKVDQLMQELETRHLEIEAKDSTIQTLHDDLNKVEPQIEVKVQEIIEKDRIIEEKKEQLQQQNKILVEIQITLDEKQKQIAELEESLSEARQKVEKLDKDFSFSLKTIKEMAAEVLIRDKEIVHLKKELKRKEKKVKDLLAELKEALDMLKKAKWEAETSGGQDGVKEMVEEENERLWAELEQRKLELMNVRAEKESLTKEVEEREEALKRQKEEAEERIRSLLKQIEREGREEEAGESEKGESDFDLASLREKLESRDGILKSQEVVIDALKADLAKAMEELFERKEELKDLKKELSRKSLDMQDFITKELFGRSKEVKELQDKLCGFSKGQDNPLEALKLFFQANQVKFDPEVSPSKTSQQVQVRSNSLSKLNEEPVVNASEKDNSSSQPTSKAGRSNSFSLLENALYAQMGQKVYNTNQTFNTYVLSGDAEGKPSDVIPLNEVAPTIPTEALKLEIDSKEDSNTNPDKAFLASILSKETGKNGSKSLSSTNGQVSQSKDDTEVEICSIPQSACISENALQLLYQEVNNIRNETQALRKDREILSEKVYALQTLNDQLSSKSTDPQQCNQLESEMSFLKKQLEESREENLTKDKVHGEIVSDFKGQVEILKGELKGVKRKVTLQLLQMASTKYQESLKNYKQEIISLRKRLADSHNACDLLRNRLEELVDFLEQILDMDKRGIIDLSHLSSSQRASLQKSLDDSRSLSHSLSHSLMIGTDSLLGETLNDEAASRFSLPLENLPQEINFSQFENSYATDVGLSHSDLSAFDLTNDMMYHSFAAKVSSQIDSKTQEIDTITTKLSLLSGILESKDEQLRVQTETVVNLQNQVAKLREEVQMKDQLLNEAKNTTTVGTLSQISGKDFISEITMQNDSKDSNLSLHLSSLQHSLPSPAFDPRLHEGLFILPGESSSSDTLPPPPPDLSSQEDCNSFVSTERLSSVIDCQPKQSVPCQSDIGSAYSTDIVVKSLPKLSDPLFLKSAADTPQPSHPLGMSLEQPTLPPSFALASPSESEAWSEPDRNVSLARIGLETCNLVSASHDRSLSRSRMTRSAPFTSESEGEGNPEEAKEGSAGLGTPSSKSKRRSDAAEVKRLASKLRTVEQLNETLRAELHIYQTLNQQFNTSSKEKTLQPDVDSSKRPSGDDISVNSLMGNSEVSHENPIPLDENCSLMIPSSLLHEIRSLRMKLEEAIANNDLLRDQLEAALSGYLSEESRHLTAKLSAVQQELKLNQEKLLIAANAEEQLRIQVKVNETKMFELGERLADYMTCNQKLEKKINDLNDELRESRETLRKTEEELKTVRALREEKEWAQKEIRESKCFQMEVEITALKTDLKNLHQVEKEKERKLEEQRRYILGLEEAKADYESRLSEQDSAINELCQSITKLQQESTKSSVSDQLVSKLQEALQNSEGRLLQVTKERFALVGERARLQAQLASVTTHAKLLQREVREMSVSEEPSMSDLEYKQIFQRLKSAQTTIIELQQDKELFQSEKQAMQKEMQLLQEEISALRSHLDHVLSREAVTNSREIRELAGLQMSYQNLQEKHVSLENSYKNSYKNLLSEKSTLEEKLKEVQIKEKEINQLKKNLKENELKREEIISQLDAERCLSRNLQIQIKNLQSNSSYHKVPSHDLESTSATSSELIRPRERMISTKTGRGIVSPLKKSSSISSWSEDKENQFPHYSHSRKTLSLPHIEDDVTSGESPDLGIGSDGQFSSLERLGGSRRLTREMNQRFYKSESKEEERSARLCSEPSHSQLFSEIERLRQEREDLNTKMVSMEESLKDALNQLAKANKRKESVERAICRQLTKTHDVLKRAKGNLRQAKGKGGSQVKSEQNPSTNERQETG